MSELINYINAFILRRKYNVLVIYTQDFYTYMDNVTPCFEVEGSLIVVKKSKKQSDGYKTYVIWKD